MTRSMMLFVGLALLAMAGSASALPTAAPLAPTSEVKNAAVVCGYRGCVRVYHRPYYGYYRPYYRPYRYW